MIGTPCGSNACRGTVRAHDSVGDYILQRLRNERIIPQDYKDTDSMSCVLPPCRAGLLATTDSSITQEQ